MLLKGGFYAGSEYAIITSLDPTVGPSTPPGWPFRLILHGSRPVSSVPEQSCQFPLISLLIIEQTLTGYLSVPLDT